MNVIKPKSMRIVGRSLLVMMTACSTAITANAFAQNPPYVILLNEARVKDADAKNELPARNTMDPENARDFKGWHEPKVRAVVKILENKYTFESLSLTSHVFSSISARLPLETVELLKRDPLVQEVREDSNSVDFAAAPPWSDYVTGGETISWGKTAVDTDDALTSTNTVYVIDGGVQNHPDLNITQAPIHGYNADYSYGAPVPYHATHVAGIIGAKNNMSAVRGINPGQNIISVNVGFSYEPYASTREAIDWVLANAEENNVYV